MSPPLEDRGLGGLQGIPNGRRVIVERCDATLLSPNESTQDGRRAEGNNRLGRAASGSR